VEATKGADVKQFEENLRALGYSALPSMISSTGKRRRCGAGRRTSGWAIGAAISATLIVGGLAGLYPAVRAARLAPTEALTAV